MSADPQYAAARLEMALVELASASDDIAASVRHGAAPGISIAAWSWSQTIAGLQREVEMARGQLLEDL